jgi:hypothetical protein
MPITAVAFQSFTLWDGRGDSLWSQPLKAIENPKEMDLTRVELVRVIATRYAEAYEALFGALPSVEALPARGKPGLPAWDALPESVRIDVDEVAANVGKAIEAYERITPLQRHPVRPVGAWRAGADRAGDGGRAGLRREQLHQLPQRTGLLRRGVPQHRPALPGRGRADGRDLLLADPFNGAGLFSDDPAAGEEKLEDVRFETPTVGAFRTASLRGVGQRRFFGHAGHEETLEGFIEDVYRGGRRGAPQRHDRHARSGAAGRQRARQRGGRAGRVPADAELPADAVSVGAFRPKPLRPGRWYYALQPLPTNHRRPGPSSSPGGGHVVTAPPELATQEVLSLALREAPPLPIAPLHPSMRPFRRCPGAIDPSMSWFLGRSGRIDASMSDVDASMRPWR